MRQSAAISRRNSDMTLSKLKLTIALLLAWTSLPCVAQLAIETISDRAFNGYINGVSFQQDAITTYNGYQYAVYWSANRHVAVARKATGSNSWATLELTDYRFATDNAHYDISLGISPRDGTLHLSFYQWSSIFNYRKSVAGLLDNPEQFNWDNKLFGPVQNGLLGPVMQPTTYPRFVTEPSGKLLLLLRHGESGAGDSFLYEYDGSSGNWTGLGKLVDGLVTNINAYFNGIHYDPNGRLHATWVWRGTPDATTNFNLHYIYSDDDGRSWHSNAGQQIAVTGRTPISQNTPATTVWQIPQNRGLINQESQCVDQDGRVSMLMSHLPDNAPSSTNFENNRHKVRVYHYMRALDGKWTKSLLPGSSFSYDRNKIAADGNNNLYAVVNRDGIYRATAANNWQDWQLVQALTDQSLFAEVQLDRQRLAEENVLSFIHISNKGRMLHFEYTDHFASSPVSSMGGGPEGYQFCAFEGQTCQTTAASDVAYGASGQFAHKPSSGSILCTTGNFSEAIRGTVKSCYHADRTNNNGYPSGYLVCAEEGQTCQVSQLSQVAYGANGAFHYRLTAEPILCAGSEFADPINGVVKQCFLRAIDQGQRASSSSLSSSSSSSSASSQASSGSTAGTIPLATLLGLLLLLAAVTATRPSCSGILDI